jgi:uncharacterized protein (DUF2147 family)
MEPSMNKTFYFAAAAALLMTSSAAQAGDGFSFTVDGQKMRIEAPRNCNSLSCISVTSNGSAIDMKNTNKKGRKSADDDVATNSQPSAPPAPPAPAPAVQAPPAPAPVAKTAPPAPPAVANNVPPAPSPAPVADTTRERVTGLPAAPPAPAASTAPAAPAQAPVASAVPPAPPAPPVQQEAAAAPNTPVGLWQTQDNKGNVVIEQCGANLCGSSEHSHERILINMKPSTDNSKWTGRIHDPESGSNYDSIISMKGPNQLSVKGCAFGGLFCGAQTWKRVS